jgi:hypothetical protein
MESPPPAYQRPIRSRYVDPYEVIWLATARRLGLVIGRDPAIFSLTLGDGILWLGPRDDLDPDDTLAQMLFHELCHWFTNGIETFHQADWGFDLGDDDDPREFACLRLQAWLADRFELRAMFSPTGKFRAYFDRIPADPLAPLDDSPGEAEVLALALRAIETSRREPYAAIVDAGLAATARLRETLRAFEADFAPELGDAASAAPDLPCLWFVPHPTWRRD